MKRKKLSIWWKILIIILLFILAWVVGYTYGELTDNNTQKTKSTTEVKTVKKQIIHQRLNQKIKLSNGLVLKVTNFDKYDKINGPENAVGVTIEIKNNTKKAQNIPYKYDLNLLVNNKQASSEGIYLSGPLETEGNLTSTDEKIEPGKAETVVYLYSLDNPKDLNGNKAKLTIKAKTKKYIISLKLTSNTSDSENIDNESTNVDNNQQQDQYNYNYGNNYNNGGDNNQEVHGQDDERAEANNGNNGYNYGNGYAGQVDVNNGYNYDNNGVGRADVGYGY